MNFKFIIQGLNMIMLQNQLTELMGIVVVFDKFRRLQVEHLNTRNKSF
jgi:hypothetical protein